MTNREVAKIVRDAESQGLTGADFARHVLDCGVTLEEYQRYARRKTAWLLALWVLALAAFWVAIDLATGRAGDR